MTASLLFILLICTVSTTLMAFKKWGWIDLYATYRKKWMPDAYCWLCLGLWISVLILIPVSFFLGWYYVLFAYPAASIVNTIMNLNG